MKNAIKPAARHSRVKTTRAVINAMFTVLILLFALMMVSPFFWMVSASPAGILEFDQSGCDQHNHCCGHCKPGRLCLC